MHLLRARLPDRARRFSSGVALVLVGAGAVVISSSFGADPSPAVEGGDVGVNARAGDRGDITSHNSPTLARNPVRAANLAISNRIDTPRFGCALHVSFDAGARWRRTPIPLPPGEEPKCFAPDLAYAPDGTLYVSFVTLSGRGNVPHAGWIAKSTDGGRTLSSPTRVLGPLAFQVRLATDPVDPRRLYLSFLQGRGVGVLRFPGPGNPIKLTRSDDGGLSWRRPVRVSEPTRARVVTPAPAVGPGGVLYVLYVDLGDDRLDYEGGHGGEGGPPFTGSFELVLARSLDGGRRWEQSVPEDQLIPIERFIVFYPPFPSIAVDQSSGRVYAGFHDGRLGDPDVWIWSLGRSEARWRGPTRVNDTEERDGRRQYLPKLAVAPNGRLDVLYYDRRTDPRNVMNHVSLQSSFDEGASFTPTLRLTSRPFDSRIGFGSPHDLPDLGSRLGLLSGGDWALAVWTDTRSGTQATNKQDLFRSLVVFSGPARLAKPVEYGLRYGGLGLGCLGILLIASTAPARSAARPA